MKINMSLTTPNLIYASSKEAKEKTLKKGFTCVEFTEITGIDMEDGGAILVSREDWKRLEIFMAVLSSIEMKLDEDKLKALLILKEK